MTYFGDLDSKESLANEFRIELREIEDCEILYAYYEYEEYSGNAFVFLRKEGVLYEVNGSHCSCYGLEDQWEPEETLVEAILKRSWPSVGRYPGLLEVLNKLQQE